MAPPPVAATQPLPSENPKPPDTAASLARGRWLLEQLTPEEIAGLDEITDEDGEAHIRKLLGEPSAGPTF